MLYMKLLKTNKTKLKETKIPSNKKILFRQKLMKQTEKEALQKKRMNVL